MDEQRPNPGLGLDLAFHLDDVARPADVAGQPAAQRYVLGRLEQKRHQRHQQQVDAPGQQDEIAQGQGQHQQQEGQPNPAGRQSGEHQYRGVIPPEPPL